jgi:hypothetical protein
VAPAFEITRIEPSAKGIRQAASGLRDGTMVRRVLAMVLDGASRTEAAEACERVWNRYDAITHACRDAWNFPMRGPTRIQSIT